MGMKSTPSMYILAGVAFLAGVPVAFCDCAAMADGFSNPTRAITMAATRVRWLNTLRTITPLREMEEGAPIWGPRSLKFSAF